MLNHSVSKFRVMEFDNSEGSQRIDFKCKCKNLNIYVTANSIESVTEFTASVQSILTLRKSARAMVTSAVSTAKHKATNYSDKHQQQEQRGATTKSTFEQHQRESEHATIIKSIPHCQNHFYDKRVQLKVINQQIT